MKKYDHKKIEKKWQTLWERKKLNVAKSNSGKKKYYALMEFPYPSGDGLHTGHIRGFTAMDIIARKRRAEGFNVLYPIGWDAFGLPTENYAIKTGIHPKIVTKKNTDNFRKQFKSLGMSFDWSREINTTDPKYYKWTQWIFLQFFKNGLAYKAKRPINWCLKCKIGLADEEVVGGKCERCGSETEKRDKEQWMLAITKYADRLHKDLDDVDFLEKIKIQQRNWIGRSEGAEINFQLTTNNKQRGTESITVFTTRADTLFGATYLVLAPEHSVIKNLESRITNYEEVRKYAEKAKKKSEIERTAEGKEKTGVELKGVKAINPANKEEIPIYVADYVLGHYGTGAIMAVPAHDERDFEFAQKYDLLIREVIMPLRVDVNNPPRKEVKFVERQVVHALIRNPKTGKFLLLKWKKFPWKTLIIGGVEKEDGGDIIGAAKREVYEETGFKNLKYVKTLGGQVKAQFFATHKNENRTSYTHALVFDLENEERDQVAEEELAKHDIFWGTLNDVFPCAEIDIWKDRLENDTTVYIGQGIMINSGKFSGMDSENAKTEIVKFVGGKMVTTFKLRDWVFSRQRYWGEPIPVIHCDKCALNNPVGQGIVPVPEKDLPVELPNIKSYKPTDNGESPLSTISSWVNVKCPVCKGKAKRETDVMPNWAGSSWYFLRYTDTKNKKMFASKQALKYWTPVDWYNGGMEHTTLHLLYSRFWHKFLYDLKFVPTKEPYLKRTSHGLILAGGGVKMSKSIGNVVNPDPIVKLLGADTLRHYEMFMGPFDQDIAWNEDAIAGSRRFLERVFKLFEKVEKIKPAKKQSSDPNLDLLLNQTIKKVSEDIEELKMNTALSQLMILLNAFEKEEKISRSDYGTYLKLLAPFTPHIAEELWSMLGEKSSIHLESWPKFDSKKLFSDNVKLPVQINGKVRATIEVGRDLDEEAARRLALAHPNILKFISGKNVKRVVYIKNKVINIVL